MQILKETVVNSGEVVMPIVNESISGIYVGVLVPRTEKDKHNLQYGITAKITVSIKNRGSSETTISNLVPLVRMLQFSQFGEGYSKFIDTKATAIHTAPAESTAVGDWSETDGYYGLAGFIPFSPNEGDIILTSDEYFEIRVTNLPAGSKVACNGIENKLPANALLKYVNLSMSTDEQEKTFNDPRLHALIVPIGTSVEYDEWNGTGSAVSLSNPLDRILTMFGNSNREMRTNDVELFNQTNNDIAFATVSNYTGASVRGEIVLGAYDYGYVDLAGHSWTKIYKSTSAPLHLVGINISDLRG